VWPRLVKFEIVIPVAVGLLHLAILVNVARQHPFGNYATETDFYHLFAPDATRILAGEMPQNTFQGPGYPLVIGLLSKSTGLELFAAGKWLSVASAVLCGGLIFFLFRDLFGRVVGIGAQSLFIVSGEFPQFSINATTDVIFLLLVLVTLVLLLGRGRADSRRMALAAVCSGLAYLTRYNGIFLPVVCLFAILVVNLFELARGERVRLAALFLAIFLLTVSPWLYLNGRRYGSPLYNTNYLNMATQFYPELVAGKTNQDGTRLLETQFRSFGDVLRHNPAQVVKRYPLTVWQSLRFSLTEGLVSGAVGLVGLAGLLLALWFRRTRRVMVLLVATVLYLLLMGLNHWETRYYFFWGVALSGFAVFALQSTWQIIGRRVGLVARGWVLLPVGIFLLLWWGSFVQSRADLRRFLAAQPWEVAAARDFLRGRYGEETRQLRIVARKPHLPYLVDAGWVFFPPVRTIDEFRSWVAANQVDFIVIGKRELKERPELAPLAKSATAPEWLRPVWRYDETGLVLYRVGSF
jgi:4-amino-4-deoxy-L-arabinose transferase-like glycosyltransferase